jgi:hypothetical protein
MAETDSQQTIERTEWQSHLSADYIPKTAGHDHSAVGAASDGLASRGGTSFEALSVGETSAGNSSFIGGGLSSY